MAVIETVLVKHPTLGSVCINRVDFVPGVHELFSENESVAVEPVAELSVADLKTTIAEIDTLEELAVYIEAEQGRKDGGRKSALAALAARYEGIEAGHFMQEAENSKE